MYAQPRSSQRADGAPNDDDNKLAWSEPPRTPPPLPAARPNGGQADRADSHLVAAAAAAPDQEHAEAAAPSCADICSACVGALLCLCGLVAQQACWWSLYGDLAAWGLLAIPLVIFGVSMTLDSWRCQTPLRGQGATTIRRRKQDTEDTLCGYTILYGVLALLGSIACASNCPAIGTVPTSSLESGSDWVPASSPVPECTDTCGHSLCDDGSFDTTGDCHDDGNAYDGTHFRGGYRRALGHAGYANLTDNSVCEDGGSGSTATDCAFGSDTTDCGCRNGTTIADWVGEREYGWSDRWDACKARGHSFHHISHGVGVAFSIVNLPAVIALFGHALWTVFASSADLILLCAKPCAMRRGSAQNFERGAGRHTGP